MQLRITIAMCMVEIRNRKTLQSKVNICKSDVKIGDYADSLGGGVKRRKKVGSCVCGGRGKREGVGRVKEERLGSCVCGRKGEVG